MAIDAPAKSYERAYQVWRECGQNITETARRLKRDHDYEISRQSLTEWRKKYGWEERAAREENDAQNRQEASSDDSMLSVLLTQKKKYEDYFETLALGAVDNQAFHAYNNILKMLLDIRDRTSASLNVAGSLPGGEARVIKTPGDALDALQEAVEKKLNGMLADPGMLSLKIVKEVEKSLDLIDKMRAKYMGPEKKKDRKKQLDRETLQIIKSEIYGID